MTRDRLGFVGLEILVLIVLISGLITGTIAVTQKDTFNIVKRAAVCRFGKEDCAEIAKAKPAATSAPKPKPTPPAPVSKPQAQQPDQGVDNNPPPVAVVQNPQSAPQPVTTTAKCWMEIMPLTETRIIAGQNQLLHRHQHRPQRLRPYQLLF